MFDFRRGRKVGMWILGKCTTRTVGGIKTRFWKVQCECGKGSDHISERSLKLGESFHCGCYHLNIRPFSWRVCEELHCREMFTSNGPNAKRCEACSEVAAIEGTKSRNRIRYATEPEYRDDLSRRHRGDYLRNKQKNLDTKLEQLLNKVSQKIEDEDVKEKRQHCNHERRKQS